VGNFSSLCLGDGMSSCEDFEDDLMDAVGGEETDTEDEDEEAAEEDD
jgi:hypothetical protein